jgi:hypothetical protein
MNGKFNQKPPKSDRQIWYDLETLFGVEKILSREEGEKFNSSIDSNSRWELVRSFNRNRLSEEGFLIFRTKAFGKEKILISDEIFKPENILKTIENNHIKFIKNSNNDDVRVFVSKQLQIIEDALIRKCPTGENSCSDYELTLFFILQDYKAKLIDYRTSKTIHAEVEKEEEGIYIDYDEFDTIGKKLLLLKESGVLDHLQTKYIGFKNVNQLAKFLSQIIGEKQTSVQPVLNALIQNDAFNKNYPKGIEKATGILKRSE